MRKITDDLLLSELTVGEFKQLISDLVRNPQTNETITPEAESPQTSVTVRRKSLDEFMSDLSDDLTK